MGVVGGLALRGGGAVAEPDAKARAARLFEAGRAFAKDGDFAQACERFARSYALDPAPGTEMNLADCTEHLAQRPKAWHLFDAAALELDRAGDARATFARQRADKLLARLVTVVVHIPPPLPVGLVLAINSYTVAAVGSVREVVEPGPVDVVAMAPDHATVTRRLAGAAGGTLSIDLTLPAATAGTPAVALAVTPSHRRRSWIYTAYAAGALGGVLEGVAGIAAHTARSDQNDASCTKVSGGVTCDGTAATNKQNAAGTAADVATYASIVGAVLLVGGVLLCVEAPRDAERIRVVPTASEHSVGLALGGSF